MYSIIRLIIGAVILLCVTLIISKLKTKNKRKLKLFTFILCGIFVTVLSLVPFENLFITFDSPEKSYNYVYSEEIKLVVPGNESDLVVGEKDDGTLVSLIVPKTNKGWKIGRGFDTKIIVPYKLLDAKNSISVLRYKNTDDYFLSIYSYEDSLLEIEDSINSEFLILRRTVYEKTITVYYVYVYNMNAEYVITINGNSITPLDA